MPSAVRAYQSNNIVQTTSKSEVAQSQYEGKTGLDEHGTSASKSPWRGPNRPKRVRPQTGKGRMSKPIELLPQDLDPASIKKQEQKDFIQQQQELIKELFLRDNYHYMQSLM